MPPRSHTLGHELFKHVFCLKATDWLIVCAQILDAVNYLHSSADILLLLLPPLPIIFKYF